MEDIDLFWSFVGLFTKESIDVVCVEDRIFADQAGILQKSNTDFFWGGLYLGSIGKDTFTPSFCLLSWLGTVSDERVVVNDIGEVEFLFGKHLRKRHVEEIFGGREVGSWKLVQNDASDILGLGRLVQREKSSRCLQHVMDRGVFLKWDQGKASPTSLVRGKHL